jgi:probable HAF family extracellular repeat protein
VQRNRIGTDLTGTVAVPNGTGVVVSGVNNAVGGTAPGAGNIISGNEQDGVTIPGSGNAVQGNRIGTDITGTIALPNRTGVYVTGWLSKNTIGGTSPWADNLISGNRQDGIGIDGGAGNVVQGNRIGTNAAGTAAVPNRYGIELFSGSSASVVGGTLAGAGNVISGNRLDGVGIYSDANVLQGNFIGTDTTGTRVLGNGRNGIAIRAWEYGFNTFIGGSAAGAANVIAHNGRDGVLVDQGTGNAIQENRIFANGKLGIELRHGGNQDQSAPTLTSAVVNGFFMTVFGTLVSAADTTFTVEFFANTDSGVGEGERFVSSTTVTTDSSGRAGFTVYLPLVDAGQFLTATATDPAGNTSVFSAGVAVSGIGLTILDVPGVSWTQAYGINDSGHIVGLYSDVDGNDHGFLLSGGVYTTLDVPAASFTQAEGVNTTDQIVGWYWDAAGQHGFLLSGGRYTTIDVPGATVTNAEGINASGQIVGYYDDAGGNTHGFMLSGGVYATLDTPGATSTEANGINDLGQIVGSYQDASGDSHGFLLSAGSYSTFDVPGPYWTYLEGINATGQIVGYYTDPHSHDVHNFLLSGGSYTAFGVPNAVLTVAQGINASGQLIGWYIDGNENAHGFLSGPLTSSGSGPMTGSVFTLANQALIDAGAETTGSPDALPSGRASLDEGRGASPAFVATAPTDPGPALAFNSGPATLLTKLEPSSGELAAVDGFVGLAPQEEVFWLFA